MYVNKGSREPLVTRLDNTAEKNPLLWLPCVTLLGAICGTRRLVNDISTVIAKDTKAEPEHYASSYAVVSDKPAYVRALSAFLAAATMVTFTPGLNGISVTNAFAEESASSAGTEGQEAGEQDAGGQGAGGQEDGAQGTEQDTSSKTAASKSKNKKDIKITLNCMLKGMAGGNAHVTINKSFLDNSADVWLLSSDASRKDAEDVMMQLGENAAYYVCYPFEINIYDADSKEPITLPEEGSASVEMPVPKLMSTCADKIKVYHVENGHPTLVESEIATDEDGIQSVKFTAVELSTYIFVAPAPAKDNSASKEDTAPVLAEDNDTPASSEDTSSADAGEDNNAPAAGEDTSSAEADEVNAFGDGSDAVSYAADNDKESGNEQDDLTGEDVSSAAGAYASSAPVETAAMPVANGIAPVGEIPDRLRVSNKKRRYRIVRKRRLDDLVFVF